MPAIPYQPRDLSEPGDLVAAVRARRGGTLLNLDRMLLHRPPLAQGWNRYLRAVRTEVAVAPSCGNSRFASLRRSIMRTTSITTTYRSSLREGGTARQLVALRNLTKTDIEPVVFEAAERAVLALAVKMTQKVEVSPKNMATVRAALPEDRHVVEIVAVIATHNMVSHYLAALGVEPD